MNIEALKDRRDYRRALIERMNSIALRPYVPGFIPKVDAHMESLKLEFRNVEREIRQLKEAA